jgi:hypothetical protein
MVSALTTSTSSASIPFKNAAQSNCLEVWYFKIDSGSIRYDTSLAVFSIES